MQSTNNQKGNLASDNYKNKMGKWKSWTWTGYELGRGHKLGSGDHGPLPVITAVCE